jgi:geranylgeranyl diphosphate synthase, type II
MASTELEPAIESLARETLRGAPARLQESILYSLLGPGKRIRPRIVLALGKAMGLAPEVAVRIATGLEMVHAYTLIHDDLPAMDNDDLRRGRPTNHKVYGDGLAVLAGDSLALLGPELFLGLRGKLSDDRVLGLMTSLFAAAGARGVIAGQASEMELQKNTGSSRTGDLSPLLEIFRKKTGALFRAALEMPAIASGASRKTVEALGNVGDRIGIAFQIADDLEDDFSSKKSDSAHVAAYLDFETARTEAYSYLTMGESLEPKVIAALMPFLSELKMKISESGR